MSDGPYGWTDYELLVELEQTQKQLEGAVETLERIRDHANSGDNPALLAQHELNRIQRKSTAWPHRTAFTTTRHSSSAANRHPTRHA
jgi:hypothetical protein